MGSGNAAVGGSRREVWLVGVPGRDRVGQLAVLLRQYAGLVVTVFSTEGMVREGLGKWNVPANIPALVVCGAKIVGGGIGMRTEFLLDNTDAGNMLETACRDHEVTVQRYDLLADRTSIGDVANSAVAFLGLGI